jgi:hypothetical protein
MAVFMNGTATFSSTPLAEVVSWEVNAGGERVTHSADVDQYLTWQAVVKRDVTARVTMDDVAQAAGYDDVVGDAAAARSLVAKTADGGSDCTVAGSAMLLSTSAQVQHASADNNSTLEFGFVSADGTTAPLTVS